MSRLRTRREQPPAGGRSRTQSERVSPLASGEQRWAARSGRLRCRSASWWVRRPVARPPTRRAGSAGASQGPDRGTAGHRGPVTTKEGRCHERRPSRLAHGHVRPDLPLVNGRWSSTARVPGSPSWRTPTRPSRPGQPWPKPGSRSATCGSIPASKSWTAGSDSRPTVASPNGSSVPLPTTQTPSSSTSAPPARATPPYESMSREG